MTKLTLLAATFIAFLLLVEASRVTTVTKEDDEKGNPKMKSCQKQVQRQKYLRNCQEYMKEKADYNKQLNHEKDEEYPEECCEELRQMDYRCCCEGLKQAILQLQTKGELEGEDLSHAYWIARDLPLTCGLKAGQCRLQ